jgi:hypothetical protein
MQFLHGRLEVDGAQLDKVCLDFYREGARGAKFRKGIQAVPIYY